MYTLKTLPVKNKHFGDQYVKLLKIHILKKQKYFQQKYLNQCRNNPNEPQNIPN